MDVAYLGSVPEEITVFIETTDVTNTLRNVVSLGGDTDTIACIAGSIAEAFYGYSDALREVCESHLPNRMIAILRHFKGEVEERGENLVGYRKV